MSESKDIKTEEKSAEAAKEANNAKNTSKNEMAKGDNNKGKDKGGKKSKVNFLLKPPKGTKDFGPDEMAVRELVFETARKIFQRHGAVTIQTPMFELKDILTGKYGEDSKLIYDLKDQGGEICALRYDLTVPFARYCASHAVDQIKRYQIGRVFRRDEPSMNRGRYREFYQCDFDIVGHFDAMLPESECLAILVDILDALDLKTFEIKLNHRRLLEAMFDSVGAPADLFAPICSAVDKLDKLKWEEVKEELITKGLTSEQADQLGVLVQQRDEPKTLLAAIRAQDAFKTEKAVAALDDMELLFTYLDAYGVNTRVKFDLSLARGLDYYTGMIFEAIVFDNKVRVGSVSGGGRYDELIGMFSGKPIPSMGFSLGVERLCVLLEQKLKREKRSLSAAHTKVYVCSIGDGLLEARMALCRLLWDAGIAAEFLMKDKAKIQAQLKKAQTRDIPVAVVFGEDELARGELNLKNLVKSEQKTIKKEELVEEVKQMLAGDN